MLAMALAGKNGNTCTVIVLVLFSYLLSGSMLTGHKKDEIERLFRYVQSFLFT